jgi:hypothetical protein
MGMVRISEAELARDLHAVLANHRKRGNHFGIVIDISSER